jgi:hypothetical protein
VFVIVQELLRDADLREEDRLVEFIESSRLFMRARLLQVGTLARAIQRHLALGAAADRADAPVNSGAEALLFS